MARTLTSPATTEKDRETGAFFRRFLEIQWGGEIGTKYYSTEDLTTPVTTDGRVLDWGQLQLDAEPGKVGGYGQMTIRIEDHDHALDAIFQTKPGVQSKVARILLWFVGTTWPTDIVVEFSGFLTAPMTWDGRTAIWSITLQGAEKQLDRSVGQPLTRQLFPDIVCDDCEGEIVPIVYGDPVIRVPACLVDRPGHAALDVTLLVHDETLTINRPAGEAGFTVGETITIQVGAAGAFELLTGFFDDSDDTTFTILSRSSIQASGESPGVYAEGGIQYFVINDIDLTNPTDSRRGYPIWVDLDDGHGWRYFTVAYWFKTGSGRGVISEPFDLIFGIGDRWKLGAWKLIPIWSVGTPVIEVGTWKYVVNWLPSKEIVRVESKADVQTPGDAGGTVEQWFTFDPVDTTLNLNDKAYNANLGRHPTDDPGLTTITLSASPSSLGFKDNKIWATVRGITSDETPSGTPLVNASDIIKSILTSPRIGNISSGRVDTTSFDAAAVLIDTEMAFAILAEVKLLDLCGDLAHQACCLFFWDQGTARLKRLTDELVGGSVLEVTEENHSARAGLLINELAMKAIPTQVSGKFKTSIPGTEVKLLRESAEAVAAYGATRRELDMWAYQKPSQVALAIEFWLRFWLSVQRTVQVTCYLNALHVQPGDTITADVNDGAGETILSDQLARVKSVRRTAANAQAGTMEWIQITAEYGLWTFEIQAIAPDDIDCEAPISSPSPFGPGSTTLPPPRFPTEPEGEDESEGGGDPGDSSEGAGSSGDSSGDSSGTSSSGSSDAGDECQRVYPVADLFVGDGWYVPGGGPFYEALNEPGGPSIAEIAHKPWGDGGGSDGLGGESWLGLQLGTLIEPSGIAFGEFVLRIYHGAGGGPNFGSMYAELRCGATVLHAVSPSGFSGDWEMVSHTLTIGVGDVADWSDLQLWIRSSLGSYKVAWVELSLKCPGGVGSESGEQPDDSSGVFDSSLVSSEGGYIGDILASGLLSYDGAPCPTTAIAWCLAPIGPNVWRSVCSFPLCCQEGSPLAYWYLYNEGASSRMELRTVGGSLLATFEDPTYDPPTTAAGFYRAGPTGWHGTIGVEFEPCTDEGCDESCESDSSSSGSSSDSIETTPDCAGCEDGAAESYRVLAAGVNGDVATPPPEDCDACEQFQDVIVSHASSCEWFSSSLSGFGDCYISGPGSVKLEYIGAGVWRVDFFISSTLVARYETNAFNCLAPSTFNRISNEAFPCLNWPSTLTTMPV